MKYLELPKNFRCFGNFSGQFWKSPSTRFSGLLATMFIFKFDWYLANFIKT